MWRFILLMLISFCFGSGIFAQDNAQNKAQEKDVSKMVLRANTRDKMMVCRNNQHQRMQQHRRQEMIKMNQMQMQRRMQMQNQRKMMRQQRMHQQRLQQQRVQRQLNQQRAGRGR